MTTTCHEHDSNTSSFDVETDEKITNNTNDYKLLNPLSDFDSVEEMAQLYNKVEGGVSRTRKNIKKTNKGSYIVKEKTMTCNSTSDSHGHAHGRHHSSHAHDVALHDASDSCGDSHGGHAHSSSEVHGSSFATSSSLNSNDVLHDLHVHSVNHAHAHGTQTKLETKHVHAKDGREDDIEHMPHRCWWKNPKLKRIVIMMVLSLIYSCSEIGFSLWYGSLVMFSDGLFSY